MKRTLKLILATLLVAITASSCKSCKEQPNSNLLDPNAMVIVNVSDGKTTRVVNPDLPNNPLHLTPHQLVEQAEFMVTDTEKYTDTKLLLSGIIEKNFGAFLVEAGLKEFGDYQYKDVKNARFTFYGDMILNTRDPNNVQLESSFFLQKNVRFVDKEDKIIGYIPQRVFTEAWKEIEKAYNAKDYEKVYKLFEDAYTAFPCTPEEWEKLKAEGKS